MTDDPTEQELTDEEVAAIDPEVLRVMREAADLRQRYPARVLAPALVGALVDEGRREVAAGVLAITTGVDLDSAEKTVAGMARLDRIQPWRRA